MKYMKGFIFCGCNFGVEVDFFFVKKFFEFFYGNFQVVFKEGKVVICLLIQVLLIEVFVILVYYIYIFVVDFFVCKIIEGVVKDEYIYFNYGQEWLKVNFEVSKDELFEVNKVNFFFICLMLEDVVVDVVVFYMEKEDLIEDFLIVYQEVLGEIGFIFCDIVCMVVVVFVV